jgi:predicted small lipoprotein YifL
MQNRMKAAIILLSSLLYVAGCGQKGPLFLPGNTNEVSTSIPKQSSREDEDEKDKDKDKVIINR